MESRESYLMSKLEELGIVTTTIEHVPVMTVQEAQAQRQHLPGGHAKNLFVKDRKKAYWLLVAEEEQSINLKATAQMLGAEKFSFASAAELEEILGIKPGAVSPFALINDVDGRVSVVLDQHLLQASPLNFHPLRNDRTTAIAKEDFLKFLERINHSPRIIEFPGQVPSTAN